MAYDPPSYSHTSSGGGAYTSSHSSSSISPDSHFFGKHSAFNSGITDGDKPSSKVSSFGEMSRTSGGVSNSKGGGYSTWGMSSYGSSSGGKASSGEAQQRFTNAKSISSDQYFGKAQSDNQVYTLFLSQH